MRDHRPSQTDLPLLLLLLLLASVLRCAPRSASDGPSSLYCALTFRSCLREFGAMLTRLRQEEPSVLRRQPDPRSQSRGERRRANAFPGTSRPYVEAAEAAFAALEPRLLEESDGAAAAGVVSPGSSAELSQLGKLMRLAGARPSEAEVATHTQRLEGDDVCVLTRAVLAEVHAISLQSPFSLLFRSPFRSFSLLFPLSFSLPLTSLPALLFAPSHFSSRSPPHIPNRTSSSASPHLPICTGTRAALVGTHTVGGQ